MKEILASLVCCGSILVAYLIALLFIFPVARSSKGFVRLIVAVAVMVAVSTIALGVMVA